MTEEQMRHNALVYLTEGYDEYHREQLLNGEDTPHPVHEEPLVRYHIAGAHSRDKEVNDLEKALANVNELCHQQRNKIYELRHPWVKADERKPDKRKDANGFTDGISIEVLAKTEKGDYVTAWYSYQIDTWFMCLGEIAGESVLPYKVVEWMKIPK